MKHRGRSKWKSTSTAGAPAEGGHALRAVVAVLVLLAAGALAYCNSFSGPFVFDGSAFVEQNPAIRTLWPPWAPMIGTSRPIADWSFAVNYALGRTNPWGYHAANLAIHLAAAMALFGIVHRTLLCRRLATLFARAAWGLALAVALLWLVHPLQTQSVTYIYQRYESLMGLFFLLTLYGFLRAQDSAYPTRWYAASAVCCGLAVGSKEVAAAAPLLVLWYDRALVASSWRELVRRRWAYYAALAGTWAMLAGLMASQAHQFADAGVLVVKNVTPWQYAMSQPGVIAHYLRLCFWPMGLCIDYGWPVATTAAAIVPPLLLIVALAALTVLAIFRWPAWSFLGAWFFLILAPTSSVFPIHDLAFEHRMYLPLAAVTTGTILCGWLAGQWLVARGILTLGASQAIGALLVILAGVALGFLTFQRNLDYNSNLALWEDTVIKAPGNTRAHNSLGIALAACGRTDDAIAQYRKTMEIDPDYADAYNNLGAVLLNRGRADEAIALYRRALEIDPDYVAARHNLGMAFYSQGRFDDAIAEYRRALRINPNHAYVRNNLGNALTQQGRLDEAIDEYRKVLEIRPDHAGAHYNLGLVLARQNHLPEAIAEYQKALAIEPDAADTHVTLGIALARQGRADAAIPEFQKALEIKPENVEARYDLAVALQQRGRMPEAIAQWSELIRLQPNNIAALNEFAWLLATSPESSVRNGAKAMELAQRAVQLSGGQRPATLGTLAAAYAEAGRFDEALQTARKAIDLATRQNDQALAASIKAKIGLYEAGIPVRETGKTSSGDAVPP